jgi:hypothetical protein
MMDSAGRPFATFSDGTLRVEFRDPAQIASLKPLEVVVELDEFGCPLGIEIIGLETQLGQGTSENLDQLVGGSDLRFSYDDESDAAIIGVSIGTGTRRAKSVPKRGTAGFDGSNRLISIEIPGLEPQG